MVQTGVIWSIFMGHIVVIWLISNLGKTHKWFKAVLIYSSIQKMSADKRNSGTLYTRA